MRKSGWHWAFPPSRHRTSVRALITKKSKFIHDSFRAGTISIVATGIGSFIWAPISNIYGRRPVLIFSQAIAIVAGFGSAYAKSYGTIIVGRFFTGLCVASGNVVTFAVISDLFCLHERGKMLGLVTVALINGVGVNCS
jgi:MFS family permease